MTEFKASTVAPFCGQIGNFTPASLGTVKGGEEALQTFSASSKEHSKGYIQFFDTQGQDMGSITRGDNRPTTIRFGQNRCYAPAGSQEITHCVAQIEGGAEVVKDASGSYVRNSDFQAAREKSTPKEVALTKLNNITPVEFIFPSID